METQPRLSIWCYASGCSKLGVSIFRLKVPIPVSINISPLSMELEAPPSPSFQCRNEYVNYCKKHSENIPYEYMGETVHNMPLILSGMSKEELCRLAGNS